MPRRAKVRAARQIMTPRAAQKTAPRVPNPQPAPGRLTVSPWPARPKPHPRNPSRRHTVDFQHEFSSTVRQAQQFANCRFALIPDARGLGKDGANEVRARRRRYNAGLSEGSVMRPPRFKIMGPQAAPRATRNFYRVAGGRSQRRLRGCAPLSEVFYSLRFVLIRPGRAPRILGLFGPASPRRRQRHAPRRKNTNHRSRLHTPQDPCTKRAVRSQRAYQKHAKSAERNPSRIHAGIPAALESASRIPRFDREARAAPTPAVEGWSFKKIPAKTYATQKKPAFLVVLRKRTTTCSGIGHS